MNAKKVSVVLGAMALFAASATFAATPIKLKCPAGTQQQLIAQQDVACMKPNGKRAAGPVVMLYPNGKIMAQGQVADGGFRTGKWTLFDENGVKTHEIEFERGAFHGKWVEFHPNGQQKKVEMYQKGIRTGQAQEFDVNGKELVQVAPQTAPAAATTTK